MRVVVVGATGQFGRAMVAACKHVGWEVLALGHDSVEVADGASVARALERPYDVVVNATVWHGPAQEDPIMALRVNATGARVLADHAAARGALCVTVSTDYVFDGDATCPYDESVTPSPRSVYGISKATGEALVRAATADHLIVRVASLFDLGGSRAKGGTSFVGTMLANARAGKPLRVVNDQIHSPSYAPDAATVTVELIRRGARGIAHVTNSGWCSWFEMASAIMVEAGINANLSPSSLKDLPPGGPPRPRYSVLAHGALRRYGLPSPRTWRDALRDYLAREALIEA